MNGPPQEAIYGWPPAELAAVGPGALQLSPLSPGDGAIEDLADAALTRIVILAPPGTLERRFVLAHALRVLAPSGTLTVMAPKAKGGSRLGAELGAFGCRVVETARRHHRICHAERPAEPVDLGPAIEAGAPRLLAGSGLWSQPGVFSWDRLDPGSALLLGAVRDLAGRGADLGCGIGVLGRAVLESPLVSELTGVDVDRRALSCARLNNVDMRARFLRADIRQAGDDLSDLDFVVMNPPFHDGGREDRGLGLAFIAAAAKRLRKGGVCRMVANVALPYEGRLHAEFARTALLAQSGGYKVYEAVK